MVVAVLLETCSCLPHSNKDEEEDDARKKIEFYGLQTTTDRLLASVTEDLNFLADWVYVDWVTSNQCSSNAITTAVFGLAIASTILYLVSLVIGNRTRCGASNAEDSTKKSDSSNNTRRRLYWFLALLIALEAIPQIAITVVGETDLINLGCSEFSAQATGNLLSSGFAVLSRLLRMHESRPVTVLHQDEGEVEDEIHVNPILVKTTQSIFPPSQKAPIMKDANDSSFHL